MTALLTSLFLVTLAEMADKTQLLTLCLTCRYPPRKVLLGVSLAIALLNLAAVALGGVTGRLIPETLLKLIAGLLFVGFGVWSLLGDDDTEEECSTKTGRSAVLAVMVAFLAAEVGDKTQLATFSLAARFGELLPVWAGATLGMIAANALAVGGGTMLGARVSPRTLTRVSAVLFIAFGVWTLAGILLASLS